MGRLSMTECTYLPTYSLEAIPTSTPMCLSWRQTQQTIIVS